MSQPSRIPPAPQVIAYLYAEFRRRRRSDSSISFRDYLDAHAFVDPASRHTRMDRGDVVGRSPEAVDLVPIPQHEVRGKVHAMVLLVDFDDRVGELAPEHYRDLMFGSGVYPTGSVADYYHEVSGAKVELTGEVHGWLRLPRRYRDYVGGESGTGSYPNNAQRMARDAVRAALEAGVEFGAQLDTLDVGTVTSLILVHAGRDAAALYPPASKHEIWSHKWDLVRPIEVASGLWATQYLTVAHDCSVGVLAHEIGHLVFQWGDFYDDNGASDGDHWDGNGNWDLMASGAYNGNGYRPAHPAGLHKLQHGWVEVREIETTTTVRLPPIGRGRQVLRVRGRGYGPRQYLLLENRTLAGFDRDLPGAGLLVWRIDEDREMQGSIRPGMLLIQADGRNDLRYVRDDNLGDSGDPFPGARNVRRLGPSGVISTSFPGADESGITLSNISIESSLDVSLTIEIG